MNLEKTIARNTFTSSQLARNYDAYCASILNTIDDWIEDVFRPFLKRNNLIWRDGVLLDIESKTEVELDTPEWREIESFIDHEFSGGNEIVKYWIIGVVE